MSVVSDSSNPESLGRRLGIEKSSEEPRQADTKTVTRNFFTTAGAIAVAACNHPSLGLQSSLIPGQN